MNEYHIWGGNPLFGETKIQGSKNAVLPIMAASILIEGVCVLENCPKITDVYYMQDILKKIGCIVNWKRNTLTIDTTNISQNEMNDEAVTGMRSSIMLLGALLARTGQVSMRYPGGCVIGKRPINYHLAAMEQMGAFIEQNEEGFHARADRLTGADIHLPFPSVGATENIILCAVKASGITVLHNAAREPEIVALCEFLSKAGAIIEGIGESTLLIMGSKELHEVLYRIPADRIVAGTYLFSVLGTGGHILLQEAPAKQMRAILQLAVKMGAEIHNSTQGLTVIVEEKAKSIPFIKTNVYPGFPTDLQSPLIAALCKAEGHSIIEETIFENRFRVVPELVKMGADIHVDDRKVMINGVPSLSGYDVIAKELRGGAALILAGCIAEGETIVTNRHYIERGYEDICRDYQNLGVKISAR